MTLKRRFVHGYSLRLIKNQSNVRYGTFHPLLGAKSNDLIFVALVLPDPWLFVALIYSTSLLFTEKHRINRASISSFGVTTRS
jgi:hypothetical protein